VDIRHRPVAACWPPVVGGDEACPPAQVHRHQNPLIRIFFSLSYPTRHFPRAKKIGPRKHELHYLLRPRSSPPLHRSGVQSSQPSPAPWINPPYYPNIHSISRLIRRSRGLGSFIHTPQAKKGRKNRPISSGERRRRCSAPAACWPAAALGPAGSGCRGSTPTACAHQRPCAGGALRHRPRRPAAPLTSHRHRLRRLPRRSGPGTICPPLHQGKNLAFFL